MVAPLARALVAIVAISSVRAELQLTPTVSEYTLEGVKLEQLAFRDANTTATYQPPHGWDYSGSATQLVLHPPRKAQAQATISKIAVNQPSAFDDEALKRLTAEVTERLPKGSSAPIVVSQERNPLKIGGKETYQVVLSYTLLGQPFKRSVLILNREHDQLRFELAAREGDFKDLQYAFQSSLYSWQGL